MNADGHLGRTKWLAVLLLLPLACTAFAESVTITGRVADENGSPVPGTRIVATQPQSATARSLVQNADTSDAAGLFHFDIPAAGAYHVSAAHEGFFPAELPAVDLRQDSALEIRLNHVNELNETVQVHYATPIIDPEQTSEVKRLTEEELRNAPVANSQDYRSSLPLMPGVVSDNGGRPHFNGARVAQTNYRLNGFNISNPATGELTTRLNVDAVSALEWDASRFSPDRGKGSAGTVDIRTRMGDDHWRFGGTNFVPGLGTQGGAHLNHWSPRIMFSGPVRKGRGWFHNALDIFYVADTVDGLPSGQNRANSISGSNLTRFQWNVRENQILTGSFLVNVDHGQRVGLSFLSPVETTIDRSQSLLFATVKDQFLIGGGLLEVGFAATRSSYRGSPQGTKPYVVTPFGASGNYFRDDDQHSGRQEWLLNAFLKPVAWHGTHQFGVGADVERTDVSEYVIRHGVTFTRADGSRVRNVQFIGNERRAQALVEVYSYMKDRWNPTPELTLDLGFRTQWDKYSGGAPPAPRLAAAWAPKALRGTKLSAGWGVFYDPLTLRSLISGEEQASVTTLYSLQGGVVGPPVQRRYVLNPRDLRLGRFTIASLSAERALRFNIYGRVNLTSRAGSRGPSFVQDSLAFPRVDYVLENVERQRYRAAEFSARGTIAAKLEWFASYTRSSARSSAVVAYSIETPLLARQSSGPLDWDAPNRWLTRGWMPVPNTWLPHGLRGLIGETDLQFLTDYRTGFPFMVTTEDGRVVGAPNSTRFPNYFSLNLALERKFPFRGYLWAFRAGLINALDRDNPNVVNSDFDSPQFKTFGRGQPRAVNVRLRFVGRK